MRSQGTTYNIQWGKNYLQGFLEEKEEHNCLVLLTGADETYIQSTICVIKQRQTYTRRSLGNRMKIIWRNVNVISSPPLYSVEINLRLPMYSLHIASSTMVKWYFCTLDGWLNDMVDDQIIMKKNWKELKGQCYVANRLNE